MPDRIGLISAPDSRGFCDENGPTTADHVDLKGVGLESVEVPERARNNHPIYLLVVFGPERLLISHHPILCANMSVCQSIRSCLGMFPPLLGRQPRAVFGRGAFSGFKKGWRIRCLRIPETMYCRSLDV